SSAASTRRCTPSERAPYRLPSRRHPREAHSRPEGRGTRSQSGCQGASSHAGRQRGHAPAPGDDHERGTRAASRLPDRERDERRPCQRARWRGARGVIRIAAVGDLHYGAGSHDILRPSLQHLPDRADLLLLAGDLTRCGGTEEVRVLADDLRGLPIPMVAVLGNHDYHADREDEVRRVLEDVGVTVLEGEAVTLDIDGARIGIAGTKGFGGGFRGAHASDFGEPEMKAFVAHTKMLS